MSPSASSFLTAAPADLARAAELLRAGACVALPTETVYGLAADATNPAALAQVFAIKGRPLLDPLIVHVLDQTALAEVSEPDPRLAKIASLWPGPLTVVLRRKSVVPDLVTAGKDTVAVRIPAHPLFREVLRLAGRPLAAPSANPFGYVSPTKAQHVSDSLGERCPWIVDGGACAHGVESTILDLSVPGRARLLRPGPISLETMLDHIDHIVALVGVDHVGIGTDFNHGSGIPSYSDASESFNVTLGLLRRGYSASDIEKIWGGNFIRVWKAVEQQRKVLERS